MATASPQPRPSADARGGASNGTVNSISTQPTQPAIIDHPEGARIRSQVEYYFSDENLPTDEHLLKYCGGHRNLPVSINRICGFKKMREFKPRSSVVSALRLSDFLEVSKDGKHISRKKPLTGLCALDENFYGDAEQDDIAYDPTSNKIPAKPAVFRIPLLNQTNIKMSGGTGKSKAKPTGFEATYVEAPLKPEEWEVDKMLYDPDISFLERIETAIQTFKEKRRMQEQYAIVFNKLMRFGGIEATERLFQGTSREEQKQWSTEERIRNMANHKVPTDRADEAKWVVDFAGLAKGFLSSWYPDNLNLDKKAAQVKVACQVLRSFYRYLRYHNVCPEYDAQLAEALKICDIAEVELPKVQAAEAALPGDFNKSASEIYGSKSAGVYVANQPWAIAAKAAHDSSDTSNIGIRNEDAKIMFAVGVAILGSDEQCDKLEAKSLTALRGFQASLEVVDIQLPDDETRAFYKKQEKELAQKVGVLEPLGKLICKTWRADDCNDCEEWDLPKDRYPDGKPTTGIGQTYEFWIEESVLKTCFKGLMMKATVLILDGDIAILEEIHKAMISCFTFLPNTLWIDHMPREVRWMDDRPLLGSDGYFEDMVRKHWAAQYDAQVDATGGGQDGGEAIKKGESEDGFFDDEF